MPSMRRGCCSHKARRRVRQLCTMPAGVLGLSLGACLVQVLVPPLRELEGYVFEQLLRQLWRNVLLEATFGDSLAGASAAKPLLPSRHRQATREEQAVQRWLQALQVHHPQLLHKVMPGQPLISHPPPGMKAVFAECAGKDAMHQVLLWLSSSVSMSRKGSPCIRCCHG